MFVFNWRRSWGPRTRTVGAMVGAWNGQRAAGAAVGGWNGPTGAGEWAARAGRVGNGPMRGEMDRWGPQQPRNGPAGAAKGPAGLVNGQARAEGHGRGQGRVVGKWAGKGGNGPRRPRRAAGLQWVLEWGGGGWGLLRVAGNRSRGRLGMGRHGPRGLQKAIATRVAARGSTAGATMAANGREGGGVAREGLEREGHFIAGFTTLEEAGRPPAGGAGSTPRGFPILGGDRVFLMLNVDNRRGDYTENNTR